MVLDPLAQIDVVTVAAVIAIFLATFGALRRMFFAPYLEVLGRRAARIEAARVQRAEAEALLKDARERAARVLAAAKDEADRIAAAAREERLGLRGARMASASAEAEAILARGREEILAVRRSEEADLALDLRACVADVLARMIGPVDDASVRLLVGRALAGKGTR
jgi:F0F1-type ATP synthase membrane subunit b/b'